LGAAAEFSSEGDVHAAAGRFDAQAEAIGRKSRALGRASRLLREATRQLDTLGKQVRALFDQINALYQLKPPPAAKIATLFKQISQVRRRQAALAGPSLLGGHVRRRFERDARKDLSIAITMAQRAGLNRDSRAWQDELASWAEQTGQPPQLEDRLSGAGAESQPRSR
jgi:hypothetical protein